MIARREVILGGLLACGLGLPAAVAAGAASAGPDLNRVVIANDDGFSPFFSGDYRSVADARAPVKVFEWCVVGGSRVNYPSKVTEIIGDGLTEFPRRGDQLAHETTRQFADGGVNLDFMRQPPFDHLTPKRYGERAVRWHEMGAAGVHLFNTNALDDVRAAATPWQK